MNTYRLQTRRTHLYFGVWRRSEENELSAAFQSAPGGVLDEVDALLVREACHDAHHGRIDL
jgi:hypothetical protein